MPFRRPKAIAAVLLALACAAPQAKAGAWPREKGSGFLAAATRLSASDIAGPYGLYSTTYLEYGLGRKWTLGFDLGHGISGQTKAILFLRHPIREPEGGMIIAAELGLGTVAGEITLRPGLSMGRGLSFANGRSGWFALDSYAEFRLESGRTDLKADLTFGVNQSERLKTILQLQAGVSQGDPSFIRFEPSLVLRTGQSTHVELGLSAGFSGEDRYGLKLGLWRDF